MRVERYFHQSADPADPTLLVIRTVIEDTGMPPASYTGAEALDRLERFARTIQHAYDTAGGTSLRDAGAPSDYKSGRSDAYRFAQEKIAGSGMVQISIVLPKGGARTPRQFEKRGAINRLYNFLSSWLAGRDAENTPELVATNLWLDGVSRGAASREVIARGWRFVASGPPDKLKLEAQLYRKKWSTTEDWNYLGQVVVAVFGDHPPEPLTPLETTPPESVFVWERS